MVSAVRKVKTPGHLKKRLDYFFSEDSSVQAPLARFIKKNFSDCDAYVFGGVIREIGIHGKKLFKSDVDIVYTKFLDVGKISDLNSVVINKNKFGGYRTEVDGWSIDFWRAKDSWAFKYGGKEYEGVESLLETTQTNFESSLYSISSKRIICRCSFFKDFLNGYMEIVNPDAPDKRKMMAKVVGNIYSSFVSECDQSVARFVRDIVSVSDMVEIYYDFLKDKLPYPDYERIVVRLLEREGELLPVSMEDVSSFPQHSLLL